MAILLSVGLGLFLADGVISLTDDSLILLFDVHVLAVLRGLVCLFALLAILAIYGLMGLTPMIPKRLFLPVTLFYPLALLTAIPLLIYHYDRIQRAAWGISFAQVVIGLIVLGLAQGGRKIHWPLVPEPRLGARRFSWLNLTAFGLANLCGLLPAVIVYLMFCTSLAVGHFSDGFLSLHPGGLSAQVRKYVRNDGRVIQLVPMAHIGDAGFYRQIARSFPSNAIVLLEGVTDNQNLLTNKISYKRVATKLGLAEQQKEFKPTGAELVRADVDVEVFSTNTISLLNLIMRVQAKGLNAETLRELMQCQPSPEEQAQLLDDLLAKRNQHLLTEIRNRLSQPKMLIVPWGAAHMPGIAKEIQKSGFHLDTTQEYRLIRFRGFGKAP